MKYITRKGIVQTNIGGKSILVAAKALHDSVPYVTEINETTAICWNHLVSGATLEELVMTVLDEFDGADEQLVRADITDLINKLLQKGYIEAIS